MGKWSEKYLKRLSSEAQKEALEQENAIEVDKVYKSFKLPTERAWGLKQAILTELRA